MIQLHCLGPLAITIDSQAQTHFATDRARALLVYLAVQEQRPFRRDELAAMLWPEHSERQARQNLRKTLSRLRKATGDIPLLQTDYKEMTLNHALVQCDVVQFSQTLRMVEKHNHTDLQSCPECLAQLQSAIALYQGDFLQGFSLNDNNVFDEWLLLNRDNLRQQAIWAFTHLIDHYEQSREDAQLIDTAQALLALEPWHERTQRQLLRALARSGQRARALAQYEAYAALLADELGITPESETVQLYQQLQQGNDDLPQPNRWHGFPAEVSSFVGRTQELSQIIAQIMAPDCRLLTITGVGGMGKTRLALQAALQLSATDFPDGLYLVPLAQLTDATQFVPFLAKQLGLEFEGTHSPFAQLKEYLHGRQIFLLLDNFEHVLENGHLVADLLKAASQLTCLITSRHALNIEGEWRFDLRGLSEAEDAKTLFQQRAQRYRGYQFDSSEEALVHQIAHLVQGMPLALEMAAAWLRAYDLETVTQEIQHNLDFLVSPWQDLPPRHQSMRAVFAGSWQLLSAEEQQLFARLSIFRGEFALAAARTVAQASILHLANLVDRSLIQRGDNGRYRMHELLRQFAAEKLAEIAEETAVARAHACYYLTLLQEQGRALKGQHSRMALKRVQNEIENIRQGWLWAAAHGENTLLADTAPALTDVYLLSGLYGDGATLLAEAATQISAQALTVKMLLDSYRGRLLLEWRHFHEVHNLALTLLQAQSDPLVKTSAHLLLCQLYFQEGNGRKMEEHIIAASQLANAPQHQMQVQLLKSKWLFITGQRQPARDLLQESLAAFYRADDLWSAGQVLYVLGNVAAAEYEDARPYLLQMLDVYRQIGSRAIQQHTLNNLALSSMFRGDYATAMAHCQEAVAIAQDMGSAIHLAEAQTTMGRIQQRIGHFAAAQQQYEAALPVYLRLNYLIGIVDSYFYLGLLHHQMGNDAQALAYSEQARGYLRQQNNPLHTSLIEGLAGRAYTCFGDYEQATTCLMAVIATQQEIKRPGREMNSRGLLVEVYLARGQLDLAMEQVEIVLAYLQKTVLHKSEEPWRLQWACVQVLQAVGDERERPLLEQIYQRLNTQAASLPIEQQSLFWQAVPVNRAVKQAFEQITFAI